MAYNTVLDIAYLLHVHPNSVYHMIRKGEINVAERGAGRQMFFTPAETSRVLKKFVTDRLTEIWPAMELVMHKENVAETTIKDVEKFLEGAQHG
jgi:hypothetical protein